MEGGEGNGGRRLGEAVPPDIIRGEEEGMMCVYDEYLTCKCVHVM